MARQPSKPPTTLIQPPASPPPRPGRKKGHKRTAERDKGGPSKLRHDTGKTARPSYVPKDTDKNMVMVMVAGGIQQREIAAALGIAKGTLAKHFQFELHNGLTQANASVVAHLFKQTKENVRAAEFWLTNRDSSRWAHKQKIEGSMDLNVNLADRVKRAKARARGGK